VLLWPAGVHILHDQRAVDACVAALCTCSIRLRACARQFAVLVLMLTLVFCNGLCISSLEGSSAASNLAVE
jgi:putative intracellular protease/amidase